MAIHQPATPAEMDLVDQMIAARWRILRLQSIETELLDTHMHRQRELEKEFRSGRPVQLSSAYNWVVNDSRAIALASRSESRLTRLYQSNYKILRELQAARMKQSTQPEAVKPQAASTPTPRPPIEKICNNEPSATPAIHPKLVYPNDRLSGRAAP
jgi:hypothetical protein